jgi:hypothetical protein
LPAIDLLVRNGKRKSVESPFYVIEPIPLDIKCPSEPVGGINQAVEDIIFGLGVYWRELTAEWKIVASRSPEIRISRDVRNEVERVFGKPTGAELALRAFVAEYEVARIARPMVLDHVEIDVEPIGAQCRDTTLQLLPGAEPGRDSAQLILRPDVVIVKRAIAVRAGARPGGGLQYRRQPNGAEPGRPKVVRLRRQMVPPPRCLGITVRRRGNSTIRTKFVKPLKKHSHQTLPFA